jgi:hypothetical protein
MTVERTGSEKLEFFDGYRTPLAVSCKGSFPRDKATFLA